MGELIIAKSAGFCFGVTRAVNMVYEAIEKENVLYTPMARLFTMMRS